MYPMHNQMKMLWAHSQGLSANWISFSALNLTSWESFFFLPPFFVSIIFVNLLKGRDFLLMGNLYFIIKMEHNVLGIANLLGSRFFVYYMLGIKERLKFQQVYFRHDSLEAHNISGT